MKNLKQFVSHSTKGNVKKTNVAIAVSSAFVSTFMITSSVAQATDLQIYAKPEAGEKTIIMMLDTSLSMQYSDNGQSGSRLDRLKAGMKALLESTDPSLNNVKVGVGHYSDSTSANRGIILVPAEYLGVKGSSHRNLLWQKINALQPSSYTPTAHAYAEAAAYLMGTNTKLNGNFSKDFFKYATNIPEEVPDYYECNLKSYPHLSSNNRCYSIASYGGVGVNSTQGTGYECLDPTYPYLKLSEDRCYKNSSLTGGSSNRTNATRVRNCPTTHPYINRNNNKCYQTRTPSQNLSSSIEANIVYKTIYVSGYLECKSWAALDWNNSRIQCNDRNTVNSNSWAKITGIPNDISTYIEETLSNGHIIYKKDEWQAVNTTSSGFDKSDVTTKDDSKNNNTYKSPLPPEASRHSCDGQGIYVLTDGAANKADQAEALMKQALEDTSFSCSAANGWDYADNNGDGYGLGKWPCMAAFAKKLYTKNNPAKVSIQTAFVGFGGSMNDITTGAGKLACLLTSRANKDRKSDDSCTAELLRKDYTELGNGGFFLANSSDEVTRSVIQFINNLGDNPIDPLSTGAISVPVDSLNPHSFQPYGYLRAMEPKPGTQEAIWVGNLKKYDIKDGTLKDGTTTIFNDDGTFRDGTKDKWQGATSIFSGVRAGGVFGNVKYATVTSTSFRPVFVDKDETKTLVSVAGTANDAAKLLQRFKSNDLSYLSLRERRALLNYLGYDLPLDNTALPTTLTAPSEPFLAMGASIHSYPIQLTYSGTIDANGELTNVRSQSILYGSMEGAVRAVNASDGEEQMVYVPSEILKNSESVVALRKGEASTNGPKHGVSGAWVSDASYKIIDSASGGASVEATKMYVYGGMRMGGKSYFGLDLTTPTAPKQLFKISSTQTDFERMGQTWSKPVIANIRYDGKPRRVMIVGGGYDMCYEDPRFRLGQNNTTEFGGDDCNKTMAEGNAIYIVDATSGERLWWTSSATGANIVHSDLNHSIVSRISTLDRDGDGFVDHLYFGDLGGQIFRVDLDNKANGNAIGKRVVRLANLATKADGTSITNGDQPRFYQPPTLTVHDEGNSTFLVVGIASGDRSTPLDVYPFEKGRDGMLPSKALTNRPVNNVFGLMDYDVADKNLYTKADTTLISKDITLKQLQINPQLLAGKVAEVFGSASIAKKGWYRSLSSDYTGKDVANRTSGGIKAFEEEPIALTGRLFVPIYDPEGTGVDDPSDPCQPRVIGETNLQQYCLPYGACLNSRTGLVDTDANKITGLILDKNGKNQNVFGAGIRGVSMGPLTPGSTPTDQSNCGSLTILGLLSGKGEWSCNKILNPTRWYEKHVEIKNN